MKTILLAFVAVCAFLGAASTHSFTVNVPPVTVTVSCPTGTATQVGSAFTCPGTPTPPQCPSPPGAGPCPTPPGPINCPGFTNTIVLPVNWAAPVRVFTNNFGPNDAVVVTFTTGSGASQSNNLPRIAAAEWGGGPAERTATLSATACDFGAQPDYYARQVSSAPTIPFTLNNPYISPGLYPNLKNFTTYYFNLKNDAGSGCTLVCNVFVDISRNGAGN